MSEDWKVQFSKKVGQDMWNFRGATVYEVKKMRDEALGVAPAPSVSAAEAGAPEAAEPDSTGESVPEAPPVSATASPAALTPLELARQRMKGGS